MECQDDGEDGYGTPMSKWSLNETVANETQDLLINQRNSSTANGWLDQMKSKYGGDWRFY
jgi:hypothetical protein